MGVCQGVDRRRRRSLSNVITFKGKTGGQEGQGRSGPIYELHVTEDAKGVQFYDFKWLRGGQEIDPTDQDKVEAAQAMLSLAEKIFGEVEGMETAGYVMVFRKGLGVTYVNAEVIETEEQKLWLMKMFNRTTSTITEPSNFRDLGQVILDSLP